MPGLTRDQVRHEVINLRKTLQLLERSFKEEDWTRYTSKDRNDKWLKSQSILTGISHCRAVLQNLTPSDYDYGLGDSRSTSGEQFHEDAKTLLDRLERELVDIAEDLKPRARRPTPILPTLPKPSAPSEEPNATEGEKPRHSIDESLLPVDESEMKGQIDVPPAEPFEDDSDLPSTLPHRLANPGSTLLPPSVFESAASNDDARASGTFPASLQTSTALHEELSNQLAQMARQLRRNAEQFSEALATDEGVVEETGEKLERNYEEVAKERVRLRDHSIKSGGTTCFLFTAIVVVVIAFFMTFLVIRVT